MQRLGEELDLVCLTYEMWILETNEFLMLAKSGYEEMLLNYNMEQIKS